MTHATVFIIMDAARADYVRPETMPFCHGLQQQGVKAQFVSPPGFAQRTVLFSGRYPDTSGNFSAFVYDPERSPFKWLRKLGPLPKIVRARKIFIPARRAIKFISERVSDCYHADPAWIPTWFQPYFRPCEDVRPVFEPGALGATSIFDLCRAHNVNFRYLAHPVSGNDEDVFSTLTRELRAGAPYQFYAAQFSATDQKGHTLGPFSEKFQKGVLPDLDRKIASIHAALSAGYDTWDLFLCGDHGMGPVKQEVNVLKALKKVDAKPGRDYVVFVNSTLAVLWYNTEKGRREVEAALPLIPGSHVVSDDERRTRRIPLDHRWGDRMLAAEPGVMFWPDYFHVTDSKIVGMHGYLDKREEAYGMCVMASSSGGIPTHDVGPRSLVDVFPTLCQLLDLPVPATNEGKSLLAPHATIVA